jgi:hypothetical protein
MKSTGVYALILWMALNVALFLLIIPGDFEDPNNYIELMLWIPSIVGYC